MRQGRLGRCRVERRHAAVVGLLVGGWALYCGAQLALAYGDARTGGRAAAAARGHIGAGRFDVTATEIRLDHARRSFDLAHRRSSSPVLAPLRAVPVLGRQLASFSDLAAAAARVAGVATASAAAVAGVEGDRLASGAGRVTALRALGDRAASAEVALGQVRFPPREGLVGPLRRRWTVLEHEVASARATLRTAGQSLHGIAAVLAGPRRYLLLVANNAEMRAGSGMFLTVGTIGTAGGSVDVGPLRPAGDLRLPGPGVEGDADLRARWGWLQPGREWRNLGVTPRFDVTAPLAVGMWESLTGDRLDGALALDVPLLAAVLGATGPLTVGDDLVSEATVADHLLRHQYQGLDADDPQSARREQLGAMAAAVVDAVERGDYSVSRLVAGLARASRGRHLLAWSSRPDDQRTWVGTGVAGSLAPTSLAVNVLNRGGNKLDPYLDVEAALASSPRPDATEVEVRVEVANRTPAGHSSYVAGPHPESGVAAAGDYLGIIAVTVPGAATDIAVEGASSLLTAGPDGPTQVAAVPLLLPMGQETAVTVRFRLPASERSVQVVPSARVPAITWAAGQHRWRDDAPKVVSWRWE